LYLAADAGHPVRLQGCYVSEAEIQRVVEFWQQQLPGWTGEAPWESMMPAEGALPASASQEEDDLLQQAIALLRTRETISASYLQRRLRIAYPTAARLIERLEEMGLVGPPEAAGRPRRVIGGE
ncbi:MAG: DNA translocase FtsK, partial [Anaerolineae bacterium]|nr:DNA translocase FtsK [Anaerolineae bacterium]